MGDGDDVEKFIILITAFLLIAGVGVVTVAQAFPFWESKELVVRHVGKKQHSIQKKPVPYIMTTTSLTESDDVLKNPFIGLVPGAEYGEFSLPHSMVYKVITWKELEPHKGVYAFDEMEKRYNMDEFFREDVRFIFRIVLDYGTDEVHKDIPGWLYQEINGDGIWYDNDVGKGFSPNYSNKKLIKYHKGLLQAFGEKYNTDPRVAFIALGSLGHWGEWHTYMGKDLHIPFPKLPESDTYVQHYLDAFPDKKLLMRRPYPIVEKEDMGLYNDMFGSTRATNDFISWFQNGYNSSLADAFIPAIPTFWMHGPSGGEFGNANLDGSYYSEENIEKTIKMAKESHLSWIGPSGGIESIPPENEDNLDRFINTLGYRFVVKNVSYPISAWVTETQVPIQIEVENKGVAPMYYKWPLEFSFLDKNGAVVGRVLSKSDITKWVPGIRRIHERMEVPADLPPGEYTLAFAILDPDTKEPGIQFANKEKRSDGRYIVGNIRVN